MAMNLPESAGQSTTTLPHGSVGRHDGHHDGHLNCVALRHGWSRTFSLSPEELSTLDYSTLENILEINTLKLRPMGLRIFVENPAGSGSWSKIRFWKHDTSLQSTLVKDFFEKRASLGILTRLDVRDGTDRKDAESDAMSLRSVGSRIVQTIHHRGESSANGSAANLDESGSSWFGLRRRKSVKVKSRPTATAMDENDEELVNMSDAPVQRPKKVSFLSFFLPRPTQPNHTRRSIFEFFSSKPAENKELPSVPMSDVAPTPEQKKAEEENLRKRGWMPPGLARRQRSLREQLRHGGGSNPFLGGSGSNRSLSRKKSKGKGKKEDSDPFLDDNAAVDVSGIDEDPEVISEQELDDFFEFERTMSNTSANAGDGKLWSRFKPRQKSKSKRKQNASSSSEENNSQGSRLGGGAQVVSQPMDAFPDSPHHSRTNVSMENSNSNRVSTTSKDID